MKLRMPLSIAISLWLAGASTAVAGSATGSAALALAGVVAAHSPKLSPAEKKAVAAFFDGKTDIPYSGKIKVIADKIVCRTGNVDITARSCELTFGKTTKTINGRAASEMFATEAMAGIAADGAAGSMVESLSKLSCTLDPQVITEKAGGGAECTFDAAQ